MPPQGVAITRACYIRGKEKNRRTSSIISPDTVFCTSSAKVYACCTTRPRQKGEEREVRTRWSPTQIVLWDNGARMHLDSLKDPLYVGPDEAGNPSRVRMRAIETRGRQ